MGWVWVGYGLGIGWVLVGYGLGMGWVCVGYGLIMCWVWGVNGLVYGLGMGCVWVYYTSYFSNFLEREPIVQVRAVKILVLLSTSNHESSALLLRFSSAASWVGLKINGGGAIAEVDPFKISKILCKS